MANQILQWIGALDDPALSVIARDVELAVRVQEAIKRASESATEREKGNDRESR